MANANWKAHPKSSDFDTAGNWTGNAVPDGTAVFGPSTKIHVTFSANLTEIGGWTFKAGAPHYTFTIVNDHNLNFLGAGIKGTPTIKVAFPGILQFLNSSTAGGAHIHNDAQITFRDSSSAARATIVSDHNINFLNDSTAGHAKLTVHFIAFQDDSSASFAHITNTHDIDFYNTSGTGNATLTTLAGAHTTFHDNSTGEDASFITQAGGIADFSGSLGTLGDGKISAGSIAGGGTYHLGSNTLVVGSNNRSTKVSGAIDGSGGVLDKVGTGTLTLSHAGNAYSGATLLDGGTLNIAAVGAAGGIGIGFGDGKQTLEIQKAALPSDVFGTLITNLGIGDSIDLAGLKFVAGAKATLSFETLTVKSGHVTDTLSLLGSDPAGTFKVKNDGHGGSKIVLVASSPGKPDAMAKGTDHHVAGSAAFAVTLSSHDQFQFGEGQKAEFSPSDSGLAALYAEASSAMSASALVYSLFQVEHGLTALDASDLTAQNHHLHHIDL